MEIGDKERLSKVEENYDFPVVLALYVSSKEKTINSLVVDSKAQNVGDIKYSKVVPSYALANGESLALLGVKRVHSAMDYYEWTTELGKDWR